MAKMDLIVINKALDWAYDKALNGIGPFESASALAVNYLKKNDNNVLRASNSLINWQTVKCATSGFVSGLGGLIILPVAIPANISSVLFIQIRMIAAIAIMNGYDPKSDQVKSLIFVCLIGKAAIDILKEAGIKVGSKISEKILQNLSGKVITQINQKVGFRLITKFGEKGIVNIGKAIPVVGGVIGGSIEATTTKAIGKISKSVFKN